MKECRVCGYNESIMSWPRVMQALLIVIVILLCVFLTIGALKVRGCQIIVRNAIAYGSSEYTTTARQGVLEWDPVSKSIACRQEWTELHRGEAIPRKKSRR